MQGTRYANLAPHPNDPDATFTRAVHWIEDDEEYMDVAGGGGTGHRRGNHGGQLEVAADLGNTILHDTRWQPGRAHGPRCPAGISLLI